MPQRPRSHQLEDISKNAFKGTLPSEWVVREKSHDYGIDLEVEVFEPDGRATGLVFFVQLRATDSVQRRATVSMDVAQIEYFASLDTPTAIVRYCEGDGSTHWRWAFNVEAPVSAQESLTVRFEPSDEWTSSTPAEIRATLSTLRTIRSYPPHKPICLQPDFAVATVSQRFALESALRSMAEAVPLLSCGPPHADQISATVAIGAAGVAVRIDCVSSVTIDLEAPDASSVMTAGLYSLALLSDRHRLIKHADQIARALLARELPSPNRFLALRAATAITSNAVSSARMALLSGLHRIHDEFYASYLAFLIEGLHEDAERNAALRLFFEAAAAAAAGQPDVEATVWYSKGNSHAGNGELGLAVAAFNEARKLDPAYMARPYFVRELAGCLFRAGRFVPAACAYERAVALGCATPEDHDRFADALLFAGRVREAKAHYEEARQSGTSFVSAGATLKLGLSQWLRQVHETDVVPRRRAQAALLLRPADVAPTAALSEHILREVDALDPLSNFNVGVAKAGIGQHEVALACFLICAFQQSNDVDAWANAIICAWNGSDATVPAMVMTTALSLGGAGAYRRLRELLLEQGAAEEVLGELDEISRQILTSLDSAQPAGITLRLLGADPSDLEP
jgi:tetratricopeptide (TPR) repeat protein